MTRPSAIQKDMQRDNRKISRISQLSKKGTHQLCQRMTLDEVLKMALLSQDYCMGNATAEQFRALEQQMINKYRVI
jgi:ABC-type uncharacterized transport system ATPase component